MENSPELAKVVELRAPGWAPKAIARRLGMRPADIAPLVRAAAEQQAATEPEPRLIGCWASSNWSHGLVWSGHPEWRDCAVMQGDVPGLVGVLVAREHRRTNVALGGYLVDAVCLGVKNALGMLVMKEHQLPAFTTRYFSMFNDYQAIALDLAQELVFGSEEYARKLGFEPHPDFAACRHLLGSWSGPTCIHFGYRGKPHYVPGPDDDVAAIMQTLRSLSD